MKLTTIVLAAAFAVAPALMNAQPHPTFNHQPAQHRFDRGNRGYDRGGRFDRGNRGYDRGGRFDRGNRGYDRGGRFDRGYRGPGRIDHGPSGPSRGWTKR